MFKLYSDYQLSKQQLTTINNIEKNFQTTKQQILLGATGVGKTFIMANIIKKLNKNTIIFVPNKTLASQLYGEMKKYFPENNVEYFISNFDYYRPESYVVSSDTYLEKESSANHDIDVLRHSATHSLVGDEPTVVITSVSCIYGIGSPENYQNMLINLRVNENFKRDDLLLRLIELQYERNDIDFTQGKFRAKGDVVEIFPFYMQESYFQISFFDETIEQIKLIDSITKETIEKHKFITLLAASHYVSEKNQMQNITKQIKEELDIQFEKFENENKILEAQRLKQRTQHDIEMLNELGRCAGIENYSMYISNRKPGDSPYTLLDYFKDNDFLMIIDESHLSIPQIGAMYKGDRSRKINLVEHGFRLPSALENRPLKFEEFEKKVDQVLYVSATPGDYELNKNLPITEQIIRPTGLLDPIVTVQTTKGQIDYLISQIKNNPERTLITTLTKRMAEELTTYLKEEGIKVAYLHSEVTTFDRTVIINELRKGTYDVLIGINLLREGLDLPEVSLICILDADKEGFLRNTKSLIQTIGRAARNEKGRVIMFADKVTDSMQKAMDETSRRRQIQMQYNKENDITPKSIKKSIEVDLYDLGKIEVKENKKGEVKTKLTKKEKQKLITNLEKDMKLAAKNYDFEKAAEIRDLLFELKTTL